MAKYTHSQLCEKAAKWLHNHKENCIVPNCTIVAKELVTIVNETPDVIGFACGPSIIIECKTSISDFYADKNKPFRINTKLGMGNRRFFFAEIGLLNVENLPDGWGLLEISGRKIFITKKSEHFEADKSNEVDLLKSIVARVASGHTQNLIVPKFKPMKTKKNNQETK